MERANTRSLEAVTETVQAGNEETIEGDYAEAQKVSLLQYLSVADVKHIKHERQNLAKMRLVVDKITRLGVAAGVNTKPKDT
eukprot:11534102-Ditylum_brightwellii.AAC.1